MRNPSPRKQWMLGILLSLVSVSVGCAEEPSVVDDADDAFAVSSRSAITCPSQRTSAEEVLTDRGIVRGHREGNARAFLGIPYAKPPLGKLRFKAPEDTGCMKPIEAARFGAECIQKMAGEVSGSEDCLSLNVWSPPSSTTKRPILFYVHGGSEVGGSTREEIAGNPLFSGAKIAEEQGAIVVTANYRLGALGFLAHPDLAREGSPGNFALLDLIAALNWVKANAKRFGGDPSNVMLFGQSAGAVNVCALLASPLAKGLYSKVLLQSGSCVAPTLEQRQKTGSSFAESVGCAGDNAAACLRGKRAEDLLIDRTTTRSALNDLRTAWWMPFGPTVDNVVLKEEPSAALASGRFNRVPLVIGTTTEESAWAIPDALKSCAEYDQDLDQKFGPKASLVRTLYPCTTSPRAALVSWTTDALFTCPARALARSTMKYVPTYRYLYDHRSSFAPGQWSQHSSELPLVFGTMPAATSEEGKLSTRIRAFWTTFASTGKPGFEWPAYGTAGAVLLLSTSRASNHVPNEQRCDFWDAALGTK